jgi:hypothetical protein
MKKALEFHNKLQKHVLTHILNTVRAKMFLIDKGGLSNPLETRFPYRISFVIEFLRPTLGQVQKDIWKWMHVISASLNRGDSKLPNINLLVVPQERGTNILGTDNVLQSTMIRGRILQQDKPQCSSITRRGAAVFSLDSEHVASISEQPVRRVVTCSIVQGVGHFFQQNVLVFQQLFGLLAHDDDDDDERDLRDECIVSNQQKKTMN